MHGPVLEDSPRSSCFREELLVGLPLQHRVWETVSFGGSWPLVRYRWRGGTRLGCPEVGSPLRCECLGISHSYANDGVASGSKLRQVACRQRVHNSTFASVLCCALTGGQTLFTRRRSPAGTVPHTVARWTSPERGERRGAIRDLHQNRKLRFSDRLTDW